MKPLLPKLISLCSILLLGCNKDQSLISSNLPDIDEQVYEQVLISEILPDPKKGGVEFIEIYNNSDRIVDLRSLEITTVNASGKRNRLHRINHESEFLYPGRYKVLSKDSEIVQSHYSYQEPRSFHSMATFPTLTNTQGAVLLFQNNELVDSLSYNAKMHDILIKNPKGVSLERVDFNVNTNFTDNFISAAATVGYATPGYQNSQAVRKNTLAYGVSLLTKKFSPDKNEKINIHIDLAHGGKMANIFIYNSFGKQVRKLRSSHRLGTKNRINWNGTDDRNRPLPSGIYYIYTELYDSIGQRQTFRNGCLLVR